jgi:hypothetical protein
MFAISSMRQCEMACCGVGEPATMDKPRAAFQAQLLAVVAKRDAVHRSKVHYEKSSVSCLSKALHDGIVADRRHRAS